MLSAILDVTDNWFSVYLPVYLPLVEMKKPYRSYSLKYHYPMYCQLLFIDVLCATTTHLIGYVDIAAVGNNYSCLQYTTTKMVFNYN